VFFCVFFATDCTDFTEKGELDYWIIGFAARLPAAVLD
jgi:hypothetical protein